MRSRAVKSVHLITHPDAVILHRRGTFVAGRLSGAVPYMNIGAPALVMLSRFLAGEDYQRGLEALENGPAARLFPAPVPPGLVAQRLNQFQQAGLLCAPVSGTPPTSGTARVLADCADHPEADPDTRYRLCANYLLRPTPAGFGIFNAGSGEHHILSVELALLLSAFADGHMVGEVTSQYAMLGEHAALSKAVTWFAAQRFLIACRTVDTEVARNAPRAVSRAPAAGGSWRELQPDGRIPVYFFPHMENHYPLALGMIFSAMRSWQGGALGGRFQFVPITYMTPQAFFEGPYRKFGRGIWLFSNYMWSVELNLEASAAIKQDDPGNLTVHGGPSTPNYEQACMRFMQENPSVDIAVHGEGEVSAAEILDTVSKDDSGRLCMDRDRLAQVQGITFRAASDARDGQIVRTSPRIRMREPDIIPSPYSEGVFDSYEGRVEAAIVETNRGCPFGCTFCDWGSATNQKVSKFDMARVRREIEWVGRNRVRVIWIADANFGMLKRDTEIAEWVAETKRKYGYPEEVVVNYTKNATARLADIIRIFSDCGIISQGIISIQTTDEKTLEVINRKNIKTEKYDELIEIFSEQGLPLSTDLMIGLPGITVQAFERDLQRYIDVDVSVKAYPTQLLPNSPMAHPAYMAKHEISVDNKGFLLSCASYTPEDLARMKRLYQLYVAADGYATLRYVMRYLQWEHGIQAITFVQALADQVASEPDRYPAISWVIRYFNAEKAMPGGWRTFFDQVASFAMQRYGIQRDSAFDVVLQVNEAAMPDEMRCYPMTIHLAHDFTAYFRSNNRLHRDRIRPLASYGPGQLTVDDPNCMASIDFEYHQYDTHQYFWELHSAVARAKSVSDLRAAAGDESGSGAAVASG